MDVCNDTTLNSQHKDMNNYNNNSISGDNDNEALEMQYELNNSIHRRDEINIAIEEDEEDDEEETHKTEEEWASKQ